MRTVYLAFVFVLASCGGVVVLDSSSDTSYPEDSPIADAGSNGEVDADASVLPGIDGGEECVPVVAPACDCCHLSDGAPCCNGHTCNGGLCK